MKKIFPVILIAFALVSCNKKKEVKTTTDKGFKPITIENTALTYPDTKKDDTVSDTYFGTEVKDPYRWLEDDNSAETKAWVDEENKLTQGYMSKITFRQPLRNRLEHLYNYTKYSAPFQRGKNFFYFKNDGLQNQSVLYKTEDLDKEAQVFLDPNKLSSDGTVALGTFSVNDEGNLFGYSINESGSDWQTIKVRNIETDEDLKDEIKWAKFTGISWQGDGFYYSSYPQPSEGSELSSSNKGMQIKYHKIGNEQSEDEVIFEDKKQPSKYFGADVTEDEHYLIITGGMGTSGNDLRVKDLSNPANPFIVVKETLDTDAHIIGNDGDRILMMTNEGAPNGKIVSLKLDQPKEWTVVIPESEHVLESVNMAGGKLFARYIEDVKHKVYQYDLNGKQELEIPLPGQGTVTGFNGNDDSKEVFFTFTTLTQPTSIYRYEIESQKVSLFKKPEIDFDESQYETKQVFYPSKDGTKIPMYIVHKKGIELNGQNPTWLYAYGGFNISIMPTFNPINLAWLEQGGVFAIANIRGGSEYGQKWHDGGRLLNKQNVFDDFIAASEYLISEKYTSSDKLAVDGRSNGGLLIGAVMTQRPDLFGVCIPTVGVLDMLRYEQFTIGYAWASDYGSVKEEEHFKNLYSYSPLHNIKPGVEYPATMVVTADHDDRVVPAHSFKFAATLQAAQTGTNPTLIRIDKESGHGAGKPTSKILDEWADIFSFTMYNLGVEPMY